MAKRVVIDKQYFNELVGARIRYLRTLNRMSQAEFAERTQFLPSKISKIENGQQTVTGSDAIVFSRILDTSIDELYAMPLMQSEEPEHAA